MGFLSALVKALEGRTNPPTYKTERFSYTNIGGDLDIELVVPPLREWMIVNIVTVIDIGLGYIGQQSVAMIWESDKESSNLIFNSCSPTADNNRLIINWGPEQDNSEYLCSVGDINNVRYCYRAVPRYPLGPNHKIRFEVRDFGPIDDFTIWITYIEGDHE